MILAVNNEAPYCVRYEGFRALYCRRPACSRLPRLPLYATSAIVVDEICRWMDRLKLWKAGGRVAS